MSEPTRLFGGGEAFRRMLRERLGGRSSHDVGPEPRSRIPPGCLGDVDPMGRDHHRDCVVADRWMRACAVGNCQYWDPQAMKPDHTKDCPGHRGVRSIVHGMRRDGSWGPMCRVTWPGHCARRTKWGEVHEQTGKHAKPIHAQPLLSSDEPAPWVRRLTTNGREPGEEG